MGDRLLDTILLRITKEKNQLQRKRREIALNELRSGLQAIQEQTIIGTDLRDPFLVFPEEVC